jgi:hypothetical protein
VKPLLTKIALHKAIGLHLGEHEVAVSKVAATLLGPVEIASSSEPCTPDDLPAVIERLLVPLLDRKRRTPVAVGLPSSRLFFGTRLTADGGANTAEAVLQKALCSSNISVDDLTADLLRGAVNKLPVASVAACRRKYLAGIVATLSGLGVRPFRAEPAPSALVRMAASQYRTPHRSKMLLRVFLGATQGLAVAVAGRLPLAWRTFTLLANMEGFAIISAARTLGTQGRHYGIESPWDYVIVHGRPDLHERLQQAQFATQIGTRVVWHEGPALDGKAVGFGLALGCLTPSPKAFDLSRTLKSRPSLWEIFPWWDLAFTSALVILMGLVLGAHSVKLNEAYVGVRVQSSQHKCLASADPKRLQDEKKTLEDKIAVVRKFLDSRISWSAHTRDISTRLPPNVALDAFEAKSPLDCGGRTPKKAFSLRATAPPSQDGVTPREIDTFLNALRNHPLFKRDFGSAELTDITRSQTFGKGGPAGATFTIICVPSAPGPAPNPKGGGKK